MPRPKKIEQVPIVSNQDQETSTNQAKINIPKLPKIIPKNIIIDRVLVHVTDDKFFTDEEIKNEFTTSETITLQSDVLDMFGNLVFKEIIVNGVDENGKKIKVLTYEKLTKEVKQKVVKKIYTKEFNIKDIKVKDTEFNKYIEDNKTIKVKNMKPYTTRFEGWIPEIQIIGNDKTLLYLFIR
jgi:hypothetical protein